MYKNVKIFRTLADTYILYYENIVKNSEEFWLHTIFPPYIYDYNTFYQGIAGRLAFFSFDLEEEKGDLFSPKTDKYIAELILDSVPETYYWYGDPRNWSDCYEIKLNLNNDIVIRKSQILFVESQAHQYEHIDDDYYPEYYETAEIHLIEKGDINYNFVESFSLTFNFPKYPRRKFHAPNFEIDSMMEAYKTNATGKNGYSLQIAKVWSEYIKKLEELNTQNIYKMAKPLRNYKSLTKEKLLDLSERFAVEYTNKIERLDKEMELNAKEASKVKDRKIAEEDNMRGIRIYDPSLSISLPESNNDK